METSPRSRPSGPKCAALLGPMSSGKTTLLEAILARTGAIPRQNTVESGNMVGLASPEARAHGMSVEATIATVSNQGDNLTIIDCPGSVEYSYEAEPILRFCDFAIVVVEADEKKLPALQLTLKRLDEIGLPRVLFLNKIDKAAGSVQQTMQPSAHQVPGQPLFHPVPCSAQCFYNGEIDDRRPQIDVEVESARKCQLRCSHQVKHRNQAGNS